MRASLSTVAAITIGALVMATGLLAQTPPKNAVDITATPATASQAPAAAPSATIAAPASVVRVYISNLSGADAVALQGLLTQALFDSKRVVITENQSNASLTLQGRVLRQLPPAPKTTASRRSKTKSRRQSTTLPNLTDPTVVQDLGNVVDLDHLNSGLNSGLNPGPSTLPAFGLNNIDTSAADLNQYQFRLDLQLVNPQGDLVWMSGQGKQAPPFAAAGDAVNACVAPMLAAIASLTNAAQPQP